MKPTTSMDEYARFARLYDAVLGPPLKPLYRAMVHRLRGRGCASLADLCCGTGLFAGMAHRAGLDVVGVDISSEMLAVARDKYPAIPFMEEDATATSLPDSCVDAVTVSFGLHEKPPETARSIFREALRLVHPGGVMLVADYRLPQNGPSSLAQGTIYLLERLAGRRHHACFRRYMVNGGGAGFLDGEGVEYELAQTFFSGWAGLFLIPR